MGIQSLLDYIEGECGDACKAVDLLKIGRGFLTRRRPTSRSPGHFRLVVDAEGCLDRLYGGYYSDWACGGQWNRMIHFLNTLFRACHSVNLELVVFFNGALESERLDEWFQQQIDEKRKITQVLKHVNNKATPPPKVWWIAPVCLRTSLRLALRQLGIGVACSMDDHRQEVIAYCREDGFHGLLASDAMFAIFDPPRFFSSHHLKLTYKGALESKEYVLDEVAQKIDLDPKRFCLLGALLGNHILTEDDLKDFYQNVCPDARYDQKPLTSKEVIAAVIDFVRGLPSVDNLEEVSKEVFKSYTKPTARLREAFNQSIQYYINGTQEGFLKYKPKVYAASVSSGQPGSYPGNRVQKDAKPKPADKDTPAVKPEQADEDEELDLKADSVYTEGESGYSEKGDLKAPEIVIDPPSSTQQDSDKEEDKKDDTDKKTDKGAGWDSDKNSKKESERNKWPKVAPEIMRIASERHQKGLMSPAIYQVLSQGELKIDVTIEDDANRELPPALELYRPIRQNVYAIVHDLNKKRLIAKSNPGQLPEGALDIVVKEWTIVRSVNSVNVGPIKELRCDEVAADTLDWKCPSLHRLWLGQAVEDKNRRLRAFLSCMKSDTPLMLNISQVPQHLLILCCVLRFMVANRNWRVLRRHELDAFLATAVSPLLHDVETMQEMKLPMINSRGVQLAALFMAGVEAAIFANDACGAPIPWSMCCPWNFFDGKLFHFKLLKANNNTPLIDICDGHMDQMMRVEHMRNAILENIRIDMAFAKPPLTMMPQQFGGPGHFFQGPPHQAGLNFRPAGAPPMGQGNIGPVAPQGRSMGRGAGMNGRGGRGRGLLGRSPVDSRGGQLQIAGVVVGSWGGNTQTHGGGHRGNNSGPPHVTSVGPSRRGRGVVATLANRGRGYIRAPTSSNKPAGQSRYQGGNCNYSPGRGPMNNNRGKGRTVAKARPQNQQSHNDFKVTFDQPMRNNIPRGRGCTVEYPDDGGSILSVNQLMGKSAQETGSVGAMHPPTLNGQYNDADFSNFVYQNGNY